MRECIFCGSSTNPFNHIEHIIPESLGGDEVLPPGLICDVCNEYFGREVEGPALNTPVFQFLRASLCIPNKAGKQRIARVPGYYEVIGDEDGEPKMIFPQWKLRRLLEHKTLQIRIPHVGLGSIARMMLKMGLEFVATAPQYDVFNNAFDKARLAARFPQPNSVWLMAGGMLRPDELVRIGIDDEGSLMEEARIYEYSLLHEPNTDLILFYFAFGWLTFLVPLNNNSDFPRFVEDLIATNPPEYNITLNQVILTGR